MRGIGGVVWSGAVGVYGLGRLAPLGGRALGEGPSAVATVVSFCQEENAHGLRFAPPVWRQSSSRPG
jgi:hypothetical protein